MLLFQGCKFLDTKYNFGCLDMASEYNISELKIKTKRWWLVARKSNWSHELEALGVQQLSKEKIGLNLLKEFKE